MSFGLNWIITGYIGSGILEFMLKVLIIILINTVLFVGINFKSPEIVKFFSYFKTIKVTS